ncbi:MAG: FAD-dependent thymidylate synthase [Magnetococcus sp. YQC-3]
MKLIKPSFNIYSEDISSDSIYKMIRKMETAARVCYQTDNTKCNTLQESAEWIKNKIIKTGHHSVLEHGTITVDFIFDRGVGNELTRHRHASFCLSGDTKINNIHNHSSKTIKELYERANTNIGKLANGKIKIRSVDSNNNIIENKIKKIFYSGKKEVFEIKTKIGYNIKASKDHIFFTPNGEKRLEELNINDNIYINGRPCLVNISNQTLTDWYLLDELSPTEIAEKLKIPYRSVLRKLKNLNIFKKHLNDKNKEKYQRNHTEESIKKGAETNRNLYKNGRTIWNKGLKENDHPSVKILAETLRKNHYNGGGKTAENHHSWNGGGTNYWRNEYIKKNPFCEMCNEPAKEVHHLDKNRKNNTFENLLSLCKKCHKLMHEGISVLKVTIDSIISIEKIGIEDTYDLETLNEPHNFIANGFLVHNSQESSRYCNYNKDKFDNQIQVIQPFFFDPNEERTEIEIPFLNLNGTSMQLTNDNGFMYKMNSFDVWFLSCLWNEWAYNTLTNIFGRKAEEARSVLPLSLKTSIRMTCNIREMRLILNQRAIGSTGKPHPQMQEIMLPLLIELNNKIPCLFEDLIEEAKCKKLIPS